VLLMQAGVDIDPDRNEVRTRVQDSSERFFLAITPGQWRQRSESGLHRISRASLF